MDLSISQMLEMQKKLFEAHGRMWAPMTPQYGHEFIMYMVEEIGEVISIWKKKGPEAMLEEPAVREAFLEEMADVLMYYNEVLLRFHVSADEISKAYDKKHQRNMTRDYKKQYEEMLTDGKK
jgi:NTP pyrophosphatase (non-canonical NTP hydrolase)